MLDILVKALGAEVEEDGEEEEEEEDGESTLFAKPKEMVAVGQKGVEGRLRALVAERRLVIGATPGRAPEPDRSRSQSRQGGHHQQGGGNPAASQSLSRAGTGSGGPQGGWGQRRRQKPL